MEVLGVSVTPDLLKEILRTWGAYGLVLGVLLAWLKREVARNKNLETALQSVQEKRIAESKEQTPVIAGNTAALGALTSSVQQLLLLGRPRR